MLWIFLALAIRRGETTQMTSLSNKWEIIILMPFKNGGKHLIFKNFILLAIALGDTLLLSMLLHIRKESYIYSWFRQQVQAIIEIQSNNLLVEEKCFYL